MGQIADAGEADSWEQAAPLVIWREYAALPRLTDYDDFVDDEPCVPIIYEPV